MQLELLDSFAGHENLVSDYSTDFEEHLNLRKRVAELERQLSVRDLEIAKLEAIVKDFERVKPQPGEIAELENEINKLGAVEELNTGIIQALAAIDSEEN